MNYELNKYLVSLEHSNATPDRLRTYHKISFEEFENKVKSFDKKLIDNLYAGDAFIIKNVIPEDILGKMKNDVIEWGKKTNDGFQPMIKGAKDYHQYIKSSESNKYKISPVRHSYFFFRWNDDPVKTFHYGDHIWGLIKVLGGFNYDEYLDYCEDKQVIDRAQIAHYPVGAGTIPEHTDPNHNQKCILGIYLSQYGEDYESGGIYFLNKNDKEIFIEPEIDKGDAVIAYPTVVHGVKTIDVHKKSEWENTTTGRWFLGLYSNDSNEKENRTTGRLHSKK